MNKEKGVLLLNEQSHSFSFEVKDAKERTLYKMVFVKATNRKMKKALINKLINVCKGNGIMAVSVIFYAYNKVFVRKIVNMLENEGIDILEFKGKSPIDEEVEM